ncbi:MAG: formylglycine-generating enzyme family protein, partial [Pseudomonadota bacterium]
ARASPVGPPPPYGRSHVIADLNLQLAPVGAGTFTMGSPFNEPGRAANEGPQTGVILTRPFWLGKYEVTQQQWQAVMGSNPSHYKKAGMNAPVEEVSWDEAMEFCRRLTDRERAAGRLPAGCIFTLPTEAQWEYACRSGTKGAVAGNLDNMTWYDKNSRGNEHAIDDRIPVFAALGAGDSGPARWIPKLQERDANPWGFYDMHGNVAEWCLDRYADYPGGSLTDPTGPPAGTSRVYRGGGWNSPEPGVRSATRYAADPGNRDSFIGFRLALVLLPVAGTASNP